MWGVKNNMCMACAHTYIYNCHLNFLFCRLISFFISPTECMWFSFKGGAPNYYPNSFSAPEHQPSALEHRTRFSGDVQRFNSASDDNVTQVMAPLSSVRVAWSFFSMSAYIPLLSVCYCYC